MSAAPELRRPPLARCRIVLVRPQFPGNIGAAARALRNFGLSDLVLVDPLAAPLDPQARRMAARGECVLRAARIMPDLGDALADCVFVAATSARTGGPFRRQTVGPPDVVMPVLLQSLAQGPAALVFGPEDCGLRDTEVTRCHALISIPTDDVYPALNLAQAVAICLYELRRAWLSREVLPPTGPAPAAFADLEHMFGQLQQALTDVHFLYEPTGATLMHALRHLISRAQPTPMEVNVLRGLARQLRWSVEHHAR